VTQKVASLKETNYDMISHIAKARAMVEELKIFLMTDSLEDTNKNLMSYIHGPSSKKSTFRF